MKKLIIAIGACLLFSGLNGQDEDATRMNKKERMKSELNLTDEQISKMEAKKEEYAKVLSDESLTKEEKKERIIKMRQSDRDDILTQEQKEKSQQMRDDRRAEQMIRKHEHREKRAELRKHRADFDSQISNEDKQIIAELRKKMKAMRAEGKDKEAMSAERKQIQSLSLKYEDRVKAFMKENGLDQKMEGKKKIKEGKRTGNSQDRDQARSLKRKRSQKGQKGRKISRFLLMEF